MTAAVYYANNTSYDGRNYFYVPLTNITLDAVQEGDIINSALPTLPADSDSGYNLSDPDQRNTMPSRPICQTV